jgi:poly-beta-1,6-N-acetyl-D-glucosamine synthase
VGGILEYAPAIGRSDSVAGRRLVALVPAHNEERTIAATVACILRQDRPPNRLVVVCDNCIDETDLRAQKAGAETYVTTRNADMKAGALNQALERSVMPGLDDRDLIWVIDADTITSPNFSAAAEKAFDKSPVLGGVSGVYRGKPGGGWVGWCQRAEFSRWAFDARQQNGKAICLSGASSVYTVGALRQVVAARKSGCICGRPHVYNADNFTEDFELTQALLHTGSRVLNLMNVWIETAVKPTWVDLHTQRLRWNQGITETLAEYGLTRHTAPMWMRWLVYTFSISSLPLSLFLLSERFTAGSGFPFNAWMMLWLGVTAIMMTHKATTISRDRWWHPLVALVLVAELPYDTFLHVTFARSLWRGLSRARKQWR